MGNFSRMASGQACGHSSGDSANCNTNGRIKDVKRFRGGLAFKAHRLLYHSFLGWRVINKVWDVVCFFEPEALSPKPSTRNPTRLEARMLILVHKTVMDDSQDSQGL